MLWRKRRQKKDSEGMLTEQQSEFLVETLALIVGDSTKGRIVRVLLVGAGTIGGVLTKTSGPDLLLSALGHLLH